MNDDLVFGDWLRRRRKALDLTQCQLAKLVGCSTVTLRKIEAEERHPSPTMAGRLAEVLDVPPAEREAFVRYARGDLLALHPDPAAVLGAPWKKRPIACQTAPSEDDAARSTP